ncbi:CBS domain-containing protein [Anaerocolumna sp. AGMB13025]|uniref:CBS domain-containing protein n=1 Tax=Anaerocolumna sp. AGMB13025 TaxID=3039116 RepID=UPI00241FA0B1|nr:CBS domain-containing protein [Anaerocolumna sp. AGMB13025]WFR59216.1 CBS domain-containing protein [Anaerocolumna sp. AGMB13025]
MHIIDMADKNINTQNKNSQNSQNSQKSQNTKNSLNTQKTETVKINDTETTVDLTYSEDIDSSKTPERKSIIFLLTVKAFVAYLDDHCTLRQGLEKMRHHGYTAMPVVSQDGTYIGTVSEGDFLWHMLDSGAFAMKSQEEYSIRDILRKGWNPAVKIETTMEELLLRVMEQNFVPVVDDREKFVGIITRRDIIKYYYDLINIRER